MSLSGPNGRYTCQRCPARGLPRRADQPCASRRCQLPPLTALRPAPPLWCRFRGRGGCGSSVPVAPGAASSGSGGRRTRPCIASGFLLWLLPCWRCRTDRRTSLAGAGGHGGRRCPRPAWAAAGSWWPWLERQRSPGMPSPALSGSSSGVVVVILAIILLAFIVHWAGGGVLKFRLGDFVLNVGFT